MINCDVFDHANFDTPPILRSCTCLVSLGKSVFRA